MSLFTDLDLLLTKKLKAEKNFKEANSLDKYFHCNAVDPIITVYYSEV